MITTKLGIQTWLWEKEQNHRLFNFHEGYRKYEEYSNKDTEIIGSFVIKKNGPNDVLFMQASDFKDKNEGPSHNKLLNIMFHRGKYFLYEPKNKDEEDDNIIDNHLWLIMKFLPKKRYPIKQGDVVRFGRIPFKMTKCVLDVNKENSFHKDQEQI